MRSFGSIRAAFTRLARRVSRPAVLRLSVGVQRNLLSPLQRALASAVLMLKHFCRSTLKRADEFVFTPEPGATSAGLATREESRVNATGYGNGAISWQVLLGGDMTTGIFKLIQRALLPLNMGLAVLTVLAFTSTAIAQSEDESSRQITLDRFNKARPVEVTTTPNIRNRNRAALRAAIYRRTGPLRTRISARIQFEEVGVTVWRLRPSRSSDEGARVLVQEGLKQAEWTPERIEADTPLKIGDRVRLSVESPRPGFLYIIDREQYADGSLGEPMLIFPTLRTRGGGNRVLPGRLIDIRAQEEQYSYFTARPAGDRRDQV